MRPCHVIHLDAGREVICDICDADYTDRTESGGIYGLGSYAICPACTPRMLKSIAECDETHLIKARCPQEMSFADWVRDILRDPGRCPR